MALDTKKMLEDLEKFLKSDEGKEYTKNFVEQKKKKQEFKDRWYIKFESSLLSKTDYELTALFSAFEKHEDKRRDILFSQGIDGQSSLYYPLFKVFKELGVEAPEDSYGMFSSAIFDWRGYRMELYCGQGCFYSLAKI